MKNFLILSALFGLFTLSLPCAFSQTGIVPVSAKSFKVSNFDEKSGYRDWEITGDEAKYVSDDKILVDNMRLNIFDGSEKGNIDYEISSKVADVFPRTKSAGGDGMLYAKGQAFNLEGKTWLWQSNGKTVKIYNGIKILFNDSPEKTDKGAVITSKEGSFCHAGSENKFSFFGKVKMRGADADIDCEKLSVCADKKSRETGRKKAKFIEASGNAKIVWKNEQDALADNILLTPKTETATMTGNAELTDIKSSTKLFGDKISLNKPAKTIESFGGKKQAKASLTKKDGEKPLDVDIYADKISMDASGKNAVFNFSGNVKMVSDNAVVNCANMTAEAADTENSADGEKKTLSFVRGKGGVSVKKDGQTATAQSFEYSAKTGRLTLENKATLKDLSRGVSVSGDYVVLYRNDNRAEAFCKDKKQVLVKIAQKAKGKTYKGKNFSQALIKADRLTATRSLEKTTFDFSGNVSIASQDSNALCNKMTVLAKNDGKNKGQIEKIEAFGDIKLSSKNYSATAQWAKIYPKAEINDDQKGDNRTFTELLTDPEKPQMRPTVILPPLKGLGLNPDANQQAKETTITSDTQALVEGKKDRYFFLGNVEIVSGETKASCQKIETVMGNKDSIEKITATGDVKIQQGQKTATAGRADIFPQEETVTLSENPSVVDAESNTTAQGYRMIYRKGRQGVSIEGDGATQRPTIVLPPIGGKVEQ